MTVNVRLMRCTPSWCDREYSDASATSPANRRRSSAFCSGCHCTPTRYPSPSDSNACTSPSSVCAVTTSPSPSSVDTLVVVAVHVERSRADELREPRPVVDDDLVRREHAPADPVPLGAERLGKVLVQRAAPRHVHELESAADGEHRHPSLLRAAEQRELPRVAVGTRRVGERMPLRAVQLGLHVESAREDEPVESVEHRGGRGIRSRLRRKQHRDAARRGHRVEVLLREERGAHVPHALLRLLEVGGEADHRHPCQSRSKPRTRSQSVTAAS